MSSEEQEKLKLFYVYNKDFGGVDVYYESAGRIVTAKDEIMAKGLAMGDGFFSHVHKEKIEVKELDINLNEPRVVCDTNYIYDEERGKYYTKHYK